MSSPYVQVELKDSIALVTMNNPKTLNAMDDDLGPALTKALEQLGLDDTCRVIILTGAGNIFSAGGNLQKARQYLEEHPSSGASYCFSNYTKWVHRVLHAICSSKKPMIAAVTGVASGAGLAWLLAADFVIASNRAKIIPGFIQVGLVAAAGVTYHLPRLVGNKKASEILMLNKPIDIHEAEKAGLISKIVPNEYVLKESYNLAQELSQAPQIALSQTKKLLNHSQRKNLANHMEKERQAVLKAADLPEFRQRCRDFFNKKKT